MKPWMAWSLVLGTVAAVSVAGMRCSQKPLEVQTAPVAESDIVGSFTAEGVVRGKEYALSPEATGRITWLGVREGDRVQAGQPLLRLDSSQAQAAWDQARAGVVTAQESVREAQSGLSLSQKQIEASIQVAYAQKDQAAAHLARVRQKARPAELDAAQHRIDEVEARLKAARRDFDRARSLFAQGVIARANLDAAEARYRSVQNEAEMQKSARELLIAGATRAEVAEAEAAVDAAEKGYDAACAGRAQIDVRRNSVRTAEARVREAEEGVRTAAALLTKFQLNAPVSGTVVRCYVEQGAVASPSAVSMTVVTRSDLRIEAEIGSEDIPKVRTGMPVYVTSAAWPGQRFPAKLQSLGAMGELKPDAAIRTRIVRARVLLDEGFDRFKPGIEVDVEGLTVLKRALVVPSDALVFEGANAFVWVVQEGKASRKAVKVGFSSIDVTEVVSGLEKGQQVVVKGKEGLREGRLVQVNP